MSEIKSESKFDDVLKTKDSVFILFYASWCPYSKKFLPTFEKYTRYNEQNCLQVKIDDNEKICDKYSMKVYPTVIFFENGKVKKRLDGVPGEGHTEEQLKDLMRSH